MNLVNTVLTRSFTGTLFVLDFVWIRNGNPAITEYLVPSITNFHIVVRPPLAALLGGLLVTDKSFLPFPDWVNTGATTDPRESSIDLFLWGAQLRSAYILHTPSQVRCQADC